ncbi:MAG: PIN domain-containing protein [Candidatus Omnitrophica bacterium]|nr:PIN domain-containing protein [Candidatus Omnitrophota bacterium]
MILVDTSVWISHLRQGNIHLETLLQAAQVTTHDFIIAELACGNLKNRREILSLLEALPRTPAVEQGELLHFIERHSLMGKGIGFVDAHLLAATQLAALPLWTSDARLKRAADRLGLSHRPQGA